MYNNKLVTGLQCIFNKANVNENNAMSTLKSNTVQLIAHVKP